MSIAITNKFFCRNVKFVLIKSTKFDSEKCITWLKIFGKGIQEWNKVYSNSNVPLRKLNT